MSKPARWPPPNEKTPARENPLRAVNVWLPGQGSKFLGTSLLLLHEQGEDGALGELQDGPGDDA